jgi:DNA polymerase III alpha subunit
MEWAAKEAEQKSSGQVSLFGEMMMGSSGSGSNAGGGASGSSGFSVAQPSYASALALSSRELLEWEKQLLGIYLSASPLDAYASRIEKTQARPIFSLAELAPKTKITIAALVAELREVRIKRGRRVGEMMGILRLEDASGQIELVSFPDHFKEFALHFKSKEPLLIQAELDFEEDKPKLLGGEIKINNAMAVQYLKDIEDAWPKKVQLKFNVEKLEVLPNPSFVFRNVTQLLLKYPGPVPVELVLVKKGRFETALDTDQSFSVQPEKSLLEELIRSTSSIPDCLQATPIF